MKFVLDMNFDPAWVDLLEDVGLDVVHWSNVGPIRASDEEIIAWAARYDRTIITHDLDFSRLITLARAHKPSVVTVRVRSPNPLYVERDLVWVLGHFRFMLDEGALVSIDEDKRRVRMLPVDQFGPPGDS
ncbi:MAG TPA: DUF5615 family PIN-like protein [Tepidiformaceae bacterium]|nr:DUF5615 family PIN-like protein [Tepidiformaceae bacterium]